DDRCEVERDDAALRRERLAVALDHLEEDPVRGAVGVLPERLYAGILEGPARDFVGALPQGARGWPGEHLGLGRERLRDLALDVDVRIELTDHVLGDGVADRLALEQLATRLRPALGLEELTVGPDAERHQQSGDGRKRHQTKRDAAMPPV